MDDRGLRNLVAERVEARACALMLDMLMNEPVRRATIEGEAYFIARNGAPTCTAKSRSKAFGSVSDRKPPTTTQAVGPNVRQHNADSMKWLASIARSRRAPLAVLCATASGAP